MTTTWGSQITGSLQSISENRELAIGEQVKLVGSYDSPVSETGVYFYDQIESDAIDQIRTQFEVDGLAPKYIKATAHLKLEGLYQFNHIDFEIHGLVVHESPLTWAFLKKALVLIIGLIFFTPVGEVIMLLAAAWLFVGVILPELAKYAWFIIALFVLYIIFSYVQGKKG